MLIQLIDKHRRAVGVIKAALLGAGISGRSICVQAASWAYPFGDDERYSIFITAPIGSDIEPFYVTGKTIVEAVKNMLISIKGRKNDATTEVSDVAPF